MKNKRRVINLIFLVVSILLILSFFALLLSFEVKISDKEIFEIIDEKRQDTIVCTYYSGSIPFGVMVMQGFSSDQISIKSIVMEFNLQGFHVLTFDYSGHGRSSGFIDFNNTATDIQAQQIQQVKEVFKSLAGLNDSQIVLIGQSYGARIALQEQTFDSLAVAGLILIGAQINLDVENKVDVFTGVFDLELDWIINLGTNNPKTNITILTGIWDDVLPPKGALLLYEKLINDSYSSVGSYYMGTNNLSRELILFERVFHNYEIYSSKIIQTAIERAANFFGLDLEEVNYISVTKWRNISWLMIIIGFYTFFISSSSLLNNRKLENQKPRDSFNFEIQKANKFFLAKTITFFLSIPIMILISMLFLVLGMDLPLLAISYTGLFFGLGITELLFYWKGKMIGIKGEWQIDTIFKKPNKIDFKNLGLILSFFLVILIFISFFTHTGLWFFFPIRKIPWLVILTPFSSIGFYISIKQLKMISKDKEKFFINLLGFMGIILSLILIVIILAFVFGFIGIIIGIFEISMILGFIVLFGILLNKISRNDFLTAFILAFLLLWLVLPQSVVFRNPLY